MLFRSFLRRVTIKGASCESTGPSDRAQRAALQSLMQGDMRHIIQNLVDNTTVKVVALEEGRATCSIHAWNTRGSFQLEELSPSSNALHVILSAAFPSAASIISLVLHCGKSNPGWHCCDFQAVFGALVRLGTLRFMGASTQGWAWQGQADMWRGLDGASSSLPPNTVCCPRLQYVYTEGVFAPEADHFGSETFPVIVQALEARAARGAKLEVLVFHDMRNRFEGTRRMSDESVFQWFSEDHRQKFLVYVQREMVERAAYQASVVEDAQT